MERECRPPAREPASSGLARRSTIATSTPANANSPANIRPVGPPPAITTACSVIATLRPDTSTTHAFRCSHFRRFWLADGDYAARLGARRLAVGGSAVAWRGVVRRSGAASLAVAVAL